MFALALGLQVTPTCRPAHNYYIIAIIILYTGGTLLPGPVYRTAGLIVVIIAIQVTAVKYFDRTFDTSEQLHHYQPRINIQQI